MPGLNPAAAVIEKLDGAQAVADYLGVERTTVYRWTYPKDSGNSSRSSRGTGGIIPQDYHKDLLELAKELKKELNPLELMAI